MLVLGLADRMVGYTGVSGWKTLDEDMRAGVDELPELSAQYPSKEVLVAADADFFFAAGIWHESRRGSHARNFGSLWYSGHELTESCTHIMNKDKASLEDIPDLANLGSIFGVEERAANLIEGYRAELDAFTDNLETGDPLRVFVYDSGEDTPLRRVGMPCPQP